MSYYSSRVHQYFLRPRNVGEMADDDAAVGNAGSLVCGAALRLSVLIDTATQRITDAKFKAAGCGYLIAAASALTEIIKGGNLYDTVRRSESAAMMKAVAEQLEGVPPERAHCLALCGEALATALDHYHMAARVEWNGDEALICTCFGVSENSIEQVIHARSLRTIEQVTRACNAGGGCHSCHPLIEDILDDYWRTASAER